MTVAERIKSKTKSLSIQRAYFSRRNAVKSVQLMKSMQAYAIEHQFIDGSKLTCRVYW